MSYGTSKVVNIFQINLLNNQVNLFDLFTYPSYLVLFSALNGKEKSPWKKIQIANPKQSGLTQLEEDDISDLGQEGSENHIQIQLGQNN